MEEDQEYFNIEITDKIFPQLPSRLNSRNSFLNNKPHILVMSYIKQFHNGIMSLWREAISFLKEAEKLTIVGCSLREEDTFLRFALYHFGMKENNNEKFYIDIVDKGQENCQKVRDKTMKLVANPVFQQVRLFADGLEDYLDRT